jgi:hypothetical protein
MLAALGNGVKGGKWFSLMDKVYAPRTLALAWERVAANKGAAGVDRYFKHAHRYTFKPIDGFIRRRLRAILRKQDKRPGFGQCHSDHRRWPNAYFASLGLFTLYEAHCRASQSR